MMGFLSRLRGRSGATATQQSPTEKAWMVSWSYAGYTPTDRERTVLIMQLADKIRDAGPTSSTARTTKRLTGDWGPWGNGYFVFADRASAQTIAHILNVPNGPTVEVSEGRWDSQSERWKAQK